MASEPFDSIESRPDGLVLSTGIQAVAALLSVKTRAAGPAKGEVHEVAVDHANPPKGLSVPSRTSAGGPTTANSTV
jgi:hypothetical protein